MAISQRYNQNNKKQNKNKMLTSKVTRDALIARSFHLKKELMLSELHTHKLIIRTEN